MDLDDDGRCLHTSATSTIGMVRANDNIGFGITYECVDCGYTRYEPSNYEKFPDTNGLDPKLYPADVRWLRDLRGW